VPLTFEDFQFEYQPPLTQTSQPRTIYDGADHCLTGTDGAAVDPESGVIRSTTQNIEDMVDDLVGPDRAASGVRSGSQLEDSGFKESLSRDVSRPVSGAFNASDLVRQISQGSPARKLVTPMQQRESPSSFAFAPDPFAPLQGQSDSSVSGSRPGTSHQPLSPRLGYHRSSGFFNDELVKRQREIETRTSPLISIKPSTIGNSPIYTFPRNQSRSSLLQDQWQSPFSSPAQETDFTRKPTSPSRFGAIGDSRPAAATRTPTSGQPG
jgi:hypothetical protein